MTRCINILYNNNMTMNRKKGHEYSMILLRHMNFPLKIEKMMLENIRKINIIYIL